MNQKIFIVCWSRRQCVDYIILGVCVFTQLRATHARYQEEEFDQNLASLLIFFTKLGVREVYSVLYVKPMIVAFSIVCS